MKTSEQVTVWYKNGIVHIQSTKGKATIAIDTDQLMNLYKGFSIQAVLESDLNIGDKDA